MLKRFPLLKWLLLIMVGFSAGAAFAFYPEHLEEKKRQAQKEKMEQVKKQKEDQQSCSQPAPRASSLTTKNALPRQPHD